MFFINKTVSESVVDFAAEELKKYLLMMMPMCGEVKIAHNPEAKDGFRLGLIRDFSLDIPLASRISPISRAVNSRFSGIFASLWISIFSRICS